MLNLPCFFAFSFVLVRPEAGLLALVLIPMDRSQLDFIPIFAYLKYLDDSFEVCLFLSYVCTHSHFALSWRQPATSKDSRWPVKLEARAEWWVRSFSSGSRTCSASACRLRPSSSHWFGLLSRTDYMAHACRNASLTQLQRARYTKFLDYVLCLWLIQLAGSAGSILLKLFSTIG